MFLNFITECKKEQSNSSDLDLGADNVPFSDDINDRLWASDIGFNILEMYAGARSLIAFNVRTALLLVICFDTDCHPSSLNITAKGFV